jgi:hypothetical protein
LARILIAKPVSTFAEYALAGLFASEPHKIGENYRIFPILLTG